MVKRRKLRCKEKSRIVLEGIKGRPVTKFAKNIKLVDLCVMFGVTVC